VSDTPSVLWANKMKLLENNKMMKFAFLIVGLALSSLAVATYIEIEDHSHTAENEYVMEHSGRTDAYGGHNCSDASKRKGLCSGYHYHR
jgi:hypothetical protein